MQERQFLPALVTSGLCSRLTHDPLGRQALSQPRTILNAVVDTPLKHNRPRPALSCGVTIALASLFGNGGNMRIPEGSSIEVLGENVSCHVGKPTFECSINEWRALPRQ